MTHPWSHGKFLEASRLEPAFTTHARVRGFVISPQQSLPHLSFILASLPFGLVLRPVGYPVPSPEGREGRERGSRGQNC